MNSTLNVAAPARERSKTMQLLDWRPLSKIALNAASFVPVPAGEKFPNCKGWPELRLSAKEIQPHVAAGGKVAVRVGRLSGDLVDVDLDSREAIELADLYLP